MTEREHNEAIRVQDGLNRRTFLQTSAHGFGAAALGSLHCSDQTGARPLFSQVPRVAMAKRVIYLFQSGAPSQVDTFDYKPELNQLNGQPMPDSFTKGQPIAQLQGHKLKVQGHLTKFKEYGTGQYISDFLPYHRKMADQLCIVNSMLTEQINHDPAHTFMNTGTAISGRPSMGSWIN